MHTDICSIKEQMLECTCNKQEKTPEIIIQRHILVIKQKNVIGKKTKQKKQTPTTSLPLHVQSVKKVIELKNKIV